VIKISIGITVQICSKVSESGRISPILPKTTFPEIKTTKTKTISSQTITKSWSLSNILEIPQVKF